MAIFTLIGAAAGAAVGAAVVGGATATVIGAVAGAVALALPPPGLGFWWPLPDDLWHFGLCFEGSTMRIF